MLSGIYRFDEIMLSILFRFVGQGFAPENTLSSLLIYEMFQANVTQASRVISLLEGISVFIQFNSK
jgi:hypothetical protein